jgi:hypothetical protein
VQRTPYGQATAKVLDVAPHQASPVVIAPTATQFLFIYFNANKINKNSQNIRNSFLSIY